MHHAQNRPPFPPAKPDSRAASQPLLLLRGATVFDPQPRGRCDVLVASGVVAALSPNIEAPAAGWPCETLDASGLLLLPGLVDGHVHLCGGGGERGPETKVPPLPLSALTRAGVTTVVGLLGTDTSSRSPRELLAAVNALRRLGLTAKMWTGGYPVPTPTLLGNVRDDIALCDAVIGAGEVAISDHRSSQPTFEELARLAGECHVGGMLGGKAGVLHLHVGDGARGLALVRRVATETEIPGRVLQPTHCNRNPRLFEEVLALAAEGLGVAFDLTAFPPDPDDAALPAEVAAARYLDAGLPAAKLTISSDAGGCLPCFDADGHMLHMDVGSSGELLATLRRWCAAGRPLEALLPAMTLHPADALRLHGKGRVAVGAAADLLLVDATLAVRHVIAGGRVLVRDGEACVRGPLEPAGQGDPP